MPGHRQPNSLEGLSLGRVCQQLDGTCRRLQVLSQESTAAQVLALAKQRIRPYYMNALPARLRAQVIEETSRLLYGPSTDGSTLISGPAPLYLLALLLGPDIKQLKVNLCCYYGCSHQTSLLKLLATEGVGLENLDLARSALLRLDSKLLQSALINMKNLVCLTIRNIASDPVLEVVGRSCPKLLVLDVACSRQVSDAGLRQLLLQLEIRDKLAHAGAMQEPATSWSRFKALLSRLKTSHSAKSKESANSNSNSNSNSNTKAKETTHDYGQAILLEYYESRNLLCDSLRVLNIANTAVTGEGVLLALIHLPRLESLAEYNHMGRVVEIINSRPISFKTPAPFSLREASSCRTTPTRIQLLARACPKIEKLHISEPRHPPEALRLFPNLASLTIDSIPPEREWLARFYHYLRTDGRNLRELNLRITQSEMPVELDLREIFSNCPNLRTFTSDGSNILWSDDANPRALKHLRRIQLGRTVSAAAITKILTLAPELMALHVHSCFDLTNQHFELILGQVDGAPGNYGASTLLQRLTCFYIYEASKVSVEPVLRLLQTCKGLAKIGNLANWGFHCEGVRTLRTTLTNENLDVDLCPGAHWFWSNCIQ